MWILDIQKLKKSFPTAEGDKRLIVDVDHFHLNEGAEVALAGESGSGKTTFLHLISGVLKPDSGQIHLNGVPMETLSEAGSGPASGGSFGLCVPKLQPAPGHDGLGKRGVSHAFRDGRQP